MEEYLNNKFSRIQRKQPNKFEKILAIIAVWAIFFGGDYLLSFLNIPFLYFGMISILIFGFAIAATEVIWSI